MSSGKVYDIFLERYPKIDLHGFDRDSARVVTNDFVEENIILGKETIIIIHGIGSGIIRNTVNEVLNRNKKVKKFKSSYFNQGMTVVQLNIE